MPYLIAIIGVLPLIAADVWSGFRLALADPVLSVISMDEQPLSVRSPVGLWAIGLALAWFSLAYRHRRVSAWEAALVLVGGAIALLRLGNTWVDAATMAVPLGRQLAIASFRPGPLMAAAAASLFATALILTSSRPPELPPAAAMAAASTDATGRILADWRWAADVQRQVGTGREVLAARGLQSEPSDFWLDYVRIARGHERWAAALQEMNVDVVVLESADQQQRTAELVRSSPEWRVIYDAGDALVAQRSRP